MEPEKKEYYEKELSSIRRGGDRHYVWVQENIGGLGEPNLGPVDPPVVGMCGGDPFFSQYFQGWADVDELIKELEEKSTQAWGPRP